jgi:hypothetical protein
MLSDMRSLIGEKQRQTDIPDVMGAGQVRTKEATESVFGSHWVRAWITSFTNMVPITIFSLLTVSWAAPAARASRVSRTRLPLVSVRPANLR